LIQKFQLDLDMRPSDSKDSILDTANDLVNQKIIPITERLLDEWADENTHIQLDRLEIDLGDIPLDTLTHSLPDAYEKKIKETLKRLFLQEKLKFNDEHFRKTRKQALLDQLIFYLKEGEFPWQGSLNSADDLVLELLRTKKGKLERLKPLLKRNYLVDRLVGSLQADTLDLLLAELTFPDAATQAMLLIGELVRYTHLTKLNIHRKQIESAVYREAFNAVGHDKIIFSGKTISRTFCDLIGLLNLDEQERTNYQKQFVKFSRREKFLSQFIDISDELQKQLSKINSKKVDAFQAENELEKRQTREQQKNISNISNAGVILIYPYLKTLFDRLNWLNNQEFVNEDCQSKALLITDYLTYGNRDVVPEHELVLNKILCGMEPRESLNPLAILTNVEKEEADDLLDSAIKHWSILKDTSPEGYRLSFLRREGILMFREGNWFLRVERKGFDMLLEHLPYTISIVRLPWMKNKLFVEW
ncbi:MAG TPA: contractile injection system tape measure protein, partial [Sunxiuqinia sp.]|nr:contractile injection system tape measure protein [Sunxiuqinia sp.]